MGNDGAEPCERINGGMPRRGMKKTSVEWFPRGKTESYLERKIRLLQEAQGMKASLDETLASSRHFSRIEREKRSAVIAAQEATETRKAALVEASWCRILKAARITFMSAALELQKAEKKAAEAFNKAAALGVVLTNAQNPRAENESKPSTTTSKHKITAALDTAFEVDEEVALALKFALQKVEDDPSADSVDKDQADDCEEGSMDTEMKSEMKDCDEVNPPSQLHALMLERVRSLQAEQRASLASIVATRGLNALLKEESYEQDLNAKSWKGGLGDVLVKHVSRLEAEKATAKQGDAPRDARKKAVLQADVPDLGSVLVKHVSRIEREKRQAKTDAQALAGFSTENFGSSCAEVATANRQPLIERQQPELNTGEEPKPGGSAGCQRKAPDCGWPSFDELQPVKKLSRLEMEKQEFASQESNHHRRKLTRDLEAANAWGGLDLGSSLKRHVSKLEAEQAAWRRAADEAGNKSAKV